MTIRYSKTLPNGLLISGQPDLVYPEQALLLDYKTTKYLPKEPYATHALQLNAYRWLLWPQYRILNRAGVTWIWRLCGGFLWPWRSLSTSSSSWR